VLSLNVLVRRVGHLIRWPIRNDIDLRIKLAPQLGRAKADPGQLDQVSMNLAFTRAMPCRDAAA